MQRVLILGSPGAGKSTLARRLSERTGLPVIHPDAEYWQQGWVEPEPGAWAAKVSDLVQRPRWIMDGNYGGTGDIRLQAADTAIYLDYPTWLCLWRVIRRWFGERGRTRLDMAPGCPERLEWDFLLFIARYRRSSGKRMRAAVDRFAGTALVFRHSREAETSLASL
jgi:adenylate kinase family enzyme